MDEILAANFHVFHDVVEDEQHDLVVADEGWEIDHFLHENPELKRTAYAWLTDFVGWLPMTRRRSARGGPDGRLQRRDGRADRPLPAAARPFGLRRRPRRPGDRPAGPRAADRARLDPGPLRLRRLRHRVRPRRPRRGAGRAGLAQPDEPVCVVAVGGSGVGGPLLRRVVAAHPYAAKRVPGPADGRRHRPADRPGDGAGAGGRRGAAGTCPACTGCSPPATSRSSRAG